MIQKFFLSILLLIVSIASYSQCYTDQYNDDLIQNNPESAEKYQQFVKYFEKNIESFKSPTHQKKATTIIPVVFHVIHTYGDENISKEQIENQIDILNADFQRLNADASKTRTIFKSRAVSMNLEFKLAQLDEDGNCTDGITRHYSDLTDGGDDEVKKIVNWNYRKYLNIWVVKRIYRGGVDGGTVLGYATFPSSATSAKNGIVIRHDQVGTIGTGDLGQAGRTLTHEIGHWLGLYHTFQGGCTNNNTYNDKVDDTPPVAEPSYGCPIGNNTCSNDSPDEPDMIENYMDYANGSCMNMFTAGQKVWADFYLSANSGSASRKEIISATNLIATGVNLNQSCPPIADFHTEGLNTIICEGEGTISFVNYSYNFNSSMENPNYEWIFEGGSPAQSSAVNPVVSYSNSGIYPVTLIVSNSHGADTLIRKQFITVYSSVAIRKAPFGENFEGQYPAIGWQHESHNGFGWVFNDSKGYLSDNSIECKITPVTEANTRYSLIMAPVDVSGHGEPLNINFRNAYRRYSSALTEVLIIMVSEDCGKSWNTVAGLTASNGLASVSGAQPNWSPVNPSDWKYTKIGVNGYANSTNLMVRFDVISKSGNSVYLDDINLGQFGLDVQEYTTDYVVECYPNPASNEVKIYVNDELKDANIELCDLSGRVILSDKLNQNSKTINTAELSNGAYFIRVLKDDIKATTKLIIGH